MYLVQSAVTGAFKVGRSSNIERRLTELQTGSPYLLRIILVLEGQGYRERSIHRSLREYRAKGVVRGEWFIEPGLANLPDDIYSQLDIEMVDSWWLTEAGPLHPPGPPI